MSLSRLIVRCGVPAVVVVLFAAGVTMPRGDEGATNPSTAESPSGDGSSMTGSATDAKTEPATSERGPDSSIHGQTAPSSGRTAPSADEKFRQAGMDYEAGRYEDAARIYDELLDEGYDDARIHYNLGNALFKRGRVGPAILCYERALARNPSDPDAKENLAYATLLTIDKVGSIEEDFPEQLLQRLEQRLGIDRVLAALALVSLIGGGLAVPLWFSPPRPLRRILLTLVGTAVGTAVLLGCVAALELAHPVGADHAVVLAASVDGRSAPASDGTVLFTVHEGLKVEVRSERAGWVQIGLPNGLAGWIESTALERI